MNPDSEMFRHELEKVLAEQELVSEEEITEKVEDSLELEKTPIGQKTIEEAIASCRQIIKLNPDNVEACHNLLQVQPDNSATWLQLAQALVRQEQMEGAIASYQNALEIKPNGQGYFDLGLLFVEQNRLDEALLCYQKAVEIEPKQAQTYSSLQELLTRAYHQLGIHQAEEGLLDEVITVYHRLVELSACEEYYQHLGELLVKQEKWDEAIIAYRGAIEFNPESYLYYHQLGEVIYNRVMQNTESFFADYKIAELPYKKDYDLFDDKPPELCFIKDESFLQATSELDDEDYHFELYRIYLKRLPTSSETHRDLLWIKTPGASRKIGLERGREMIAEYQKNISQSILSVCLQESMNAYRKATELNYNHYKSHYRIIEILSKQGKSNEAMTACYDLSLLLSEEGSLNEAVEVFRLLQEYNQPSLGLVCESLWNDLNNINRFNKNSAYNQVEIRQDDAFAYFSEKSNYRTIDICALTKEDKAFLKQLGLSITNLGIMSKDNIFLEDIYINHFSSAKTQLKRKVARNPRYIDKWFGHTGMYLEQSIVETGYVYGVCPISGRVIRSNQSFFVFPSFFYRFVGDEVFYLLVSEWYNARYCVYFPRWDLIIKFYHAPYTSYHTINAFKAYSVINWQSFKSYISTKNKQVAPIIGDLFNNLTHYLWDLAGFQYLDDNNLLDKVDKVLVGPYDFFNLGDVFPEIGKDKIEVFDNSINLYQSIVENNYCAVKLVECFIQEKLADRIYQASLKKCSKLFLEEVEQSTQNFPVLWITIRSSRRIWTSQVQGIANIIKKLSVDFPNLSIIFDGWSRTEKSSKNDEVSIASEIAMMEQIIAMIPPEINTHNAIGRMTYEKAVWVHAIDLHISSLGAGMCFTVWLVNKPGVAHGNTFFTQAETHQGTAFPSCRENATEPLVSLPLDKITDEDNSFWGTRNYDCDWNAIYDEVVKIINGLSKKDKKTGIN